MKSKSEFWNELDRRVGTGIYLLVWMIFGLMALFCLIGGWWAATIICILIALGFTKLIKSIKRKYV